MAALLSRCRRAEAGPAAGRWEGRGVATRRLRPPLTPLTLCSLTQRKVVDFYQSHLLLTNSFSKYALWDIEARVPMGLTCAAGPESRRLGPDS